MSDPFGDIWEEPAPDLDAAPSGELRCSGCGRSDFTSKRQLGGHKTKCQAFRVLTAPAALVKGTPETHTGSSTQESSNAPGATTQRPVKGSTSNTPKSKGSSKRLDASETLSDIWAAAGNYLVPRVSRAAGRGMVLTAQAAGGTLDQTLKGTIVDRLVLQRVQTNRNKFAGLGSLLALPVMLLTAEKNPGVIMDPTFQRAFRSVVSENYRSIMQARIAEKRKRAEMEAMAAEAEMPLTITTEDGTVMDAIDALCQDLLSAITETAPQVG